MSLGGANLKFSVRTPSGADIEPVDDDNVDVLIDLEDGRSYAATFFTITNLQALMDRHRASNEFAGGSYIWAKDMIVVKSISREIIEVAIADLVVSGEIASCCTRVR